MDACKPCWTLLLEEHRPSGRNQIIGGGSLLTSRGGSILTSVEAHLQSNMAWFTRSKT
jgi:hypothetical protein